MKDDKHGGPSYIQPDYSSSKTRSDDDAKSETSDLRSMVWLASEYRADKLLQRAMEDKWNLGQFQKELLKEVASKQGGTIVHIDDRMRTRSLPAGGSNGHCAAVGDSTAC